MNQKLQSAYGLKFHPFRPDVPNDALFDIPSVDAFCRRVEFGLADGGFVMVTGDPGTGKSVTLLELRDCPVAEFPTVAVDERGDRRCLEKIDVSEVFRVALYDATQKMRIKEWTWSYAYSIPVHGKPSLAHAATFTTPMREATGEGIPLVLEGIRQRTAGDASLLVRIWTAGWKPYEEKPSCARRLLSFRGHERTVAVDASVDDLDHAVTLFGDAWIVGHDDEGRLREPGVLRQRSVAAHDEA